MTAYTLTAFIFCVLAVTHPPAWTWLRSRWADVRDALEEDK